MPRRLRPRRRHWGHRPRARGPSARLREDWSGRTWRRAETAAARRRWPPHQCSCCLDVYAKNAKKAGATREEVTEAAFLAAALRAGAAVTHGALALKLFDKA